MKNNNVFDLWRLDSTVMEDCLGDALNLTDKKLRNYWDRVSRVLNLKYVPTLFCLIINILTCSD